ncbi:GNAT family N-acetyltransferase [Dasania sp. GY-MA-18]|uniref:GNAT family N-acetyltransferase n=1 Tax=Dasania phycosphaerae TaxID=2950436 RepID=A0A9J6RR13_9GAMM|nr:MULTISPECIES: GNAT family N-acetyltransferase [Dasania]MCR8924156.1 GNAT family N-acetyltransferase [Dasania sp. GY-MA-18]MCZ0866729.1 GNAT family N-acetyltransferase [Dasania phycosphaerae]MCZ0870314.1 GNAT family N-acetyltransferase [Dasania phycosphaerae]
MTSTKTHVGEAIQAERKRLLIEATLSAISEFGLSQLTLAKIAAGAGLTAGSVNFHFASKEALLLETLQFVAEELDQSITAALQQAGADPNKRLIAIINAQLNPEITEHRKVAVWNAFSAERWAREDYKRICGTRDSNNFNLVLNLCSEIIQRADKQKVMSARAIASGIQGIIDDVWHDILYAGEDFDREAAMSLCLSFLASVFPWCFTMPAQPSAKNPQLSTADNSLSVVKAQPKHLADAAQLFDLYRQFYRESSNIKLASDYLKKHMENNSSTIFLAYTSDGKAVGFTQLYRSYCSLAAAPIFILYDLYVDNSARQLGVARTLMNQAKAYAKEQKAQRIDLETAIDNYPAQALYIDLGYKKDEEYFKYSLEL